MRIIVVLPSDRHQNARRFSSFQDDGHAVGSGVFQVGQNELVAALFLWRLNDGRGPLFRPVPHPIQKLVGNFCQRTVRHASALAIRIEKAQHPFGLLKRLNHSIQQQAIEAPVPEFDAILVMLVKGVHGDLQCGQIPGRLHP